MLSEKTSDLTAPVTVYFLCDPLRGQFELGRVSQRLLDKVGYGFCVDGISGWE